MRKLLGRRAERGASLVEYALLVGVLAVPTIGGLNLVTSSARTKANGTAAGMSVRTIRFRTIRFRVTAVVKSGLTWQSNTAWSEVGRP